MSEIAVFTLQFTTQNCLGHCSKFHAEVATYFPHIKLRTLYTLNILL